MVEDENFMEKSSRFSLSLLLFLWIFLREANYERAALGASCYLGLDKKMN